jgi:hypothetical protein
MFFAKPDRVGVFADRCHIHQTKLRFGQPAVASVAGLALINSDLAYYVEGLDWAV